MQSQVIAFSRRVEFKTLLDIECKGLTGFAPIIKDSVDDFKSLLGLFPSINIIIIDAPSAGHDYRFILDALNERVDSIKNILLVAVNDVPFKNSKVFHPTKVDACIDHLKSLLNVGDAAKSSYMSVPADSLIHFKMLPFDLFIKISEDKFVKRIPANEDIDAGTVEAFRAKGIQELFFDRKHNREFSVLLLNNMINKVEGEYKTVDEKLKARDEVFVTTKEIVQSVGLPPKVIEVCESVMESITTDVAKSRDRFSTYLSAVKADNKLTLQFRFVELSSFIATQIIENSNSQTKIDDTKKLIFAAFFCDICLTDPAHLSLRSEDSVKDLWHTEKKVVEEHALKASQMVEKYKNAPAGVDIVIREHHGVESGIGFGKISANINPLSKTLMAAQELALGFINDPKKTTPEVIKETKAKFEGTPILEYLDIFEKSCPV